MASDCFQWTHLVALFCFLGAGQPLVQAAGDLDHRSGQPIAVGEVEDGTRVGRWKITWPDGRSASGEYLNDQRHGWWQETLSDGRQFSGKYQHGGKHGLWEMTPLVPGKRQRQWDPRYDILDPTRTVAERLYLNGSAAGPWRLLFRDVVGIGTIIELDGGIQGQWVFESAHRRRETSMWVDGIRQGPAVITWADGSREEGDFRNGRRNGWWFLIWGDGAAEEGFFAAGVRNGFWKVAFPDGQLEEGMYRFGRRVGRWRVRWPDGARGTADYRVDASTTWSMKSGRPIRGPEERSRRSGKTTGAKKGIWAFSGCDTNGVYCKGKYSQHERVGRWFFRASDGGSSNVTYWRGELIGPAEVRHPDGAVTHTWYENGVRQGPTTTRRPSGLREHSTYVSGKVDGSTKHIWPSGYMVEYRYKNGKHVEQAEDPWLDRRNPGGLIIER